MRRAALLLCVLMPWAACDGWSGDFSGSGKGTTTAGFLKLGPGARAASLGEAYSALADEPTALYWNPAALTRIPSRAVTFMHAPHIESSFFDYAAYAQSLGGLGAVGAGIQYFSAGGITETDETGAEVGRFTPNDLAASVGYAYEFKDTVAALNGLSLGLAAKYIRTSIVDSAETGAADLGLLSPPLLGERLRLAVTAVNLGGRIKFDQESESLPLALRVGSAYKIHKRWSAGLDVAFPKDNNAHVAFGTEYLWSFKEGLAAAGRAGFNSRTVGDVDGFTGASLGLGLAFHQYAVDYAVAPFGGLGISHRISLTLRWGPEESRKRQAGPEKPLRKPAEWLTPEEHFAMANRLIDQGSYERAIAELKEAAGLLLPEDRRRVLYHERMGHIAFLQNDIPKAKAAFMEGLRLALSLGIKDPPVADAYAGLGLCLIEEKNISYAIKFLRKALEVSPSPKTRSLIEKQLNKLKSADNPRP